MKTTTVHEEVDMQQYVQHVGMPGRGEERGERRYGIYLP